MRKQAAVKKVDKPEKTDNQTGLDFITVDTMLEAGCEGVEIAARLGIHPDTLYRKVKEDKGIVFTAYRAQKRADGDAILREKQFALAKSGHFGMLVWLGKNRLGQKDDPGNEGKEITVKFASDEQPTKDNDGTE